jgi:hypothetical protein
MGILKKPYEISIWTDTWIETETDTEIDTDTETDTETDTVTDTLPKGTFIEEKIATIGSNTMTA